MFEAPTGPQVKLKASGKASATEAMKGVAKPGAPAPKSKLPPLMEAQQAAKALKVATAKEDSLAPSIPLPAVNAPPREASSGLPQPSSSEAAPSHVDVHSTHNPMPPPSQRDMSGWSTILSEDGTPYYYHEASRTTALHRMDDPPQVFGAPVDPDARRPASQGIQSVRADPGLSWTSADWDIVLVLPLPEERAAAAEEAESAREAALEEAAKGHGADAFDAHVARTQLAEAKKRRERQATRKAKAEAKEARAMARAPPGGDGEDFTHIEPGEMKLRKGLTLDMVDEAADGSAEAKSSTGWLIREIRRRVLDAGLACKVVKLIPCPDDHEEEAGEHEVDSGHCVTLICIGAAKIDSARDGHYALKAPAQAVYAEVTMQHAAEHRVANAAEAAMAQHPAPPEPPASPPPGPPDATSDSERAMDDKRRQQEERRAQKKAADEAEKAVSAEAKARIAQARNELRKTKLEAKHELKQLKLERTATRKTLEPGGGKGGFLGKLSEGERDAWLARDRERFPRLEGEAERREMRLPTRGVPMGQEGESRGSIAPGPRAVYKSRAHFKFPPFRSALRIELELSILEAPLHEGHGAGLDLAQLVASERVLEVIYVHDDDEVEEIKRKLVYGAAGIFPLHRAVLTLLHSYTGAEVGFYFAWVSAYTRSLWLPAFFGAILWLVDVYHYDTLVDAERNFTAAPGLAPGALAPAIYAESAALAAGASGVVADSAGYQRSILQMLFGLVIIFWSSGFAELWKRRQALIAHAWGELGTAKPLAHLNPNFKASQVKPGFYTPEGLWVSLDEKPRKIKQKQAGAVEDGVVAAPLISRKSTRSVLITQLQDKPKELWFPSFERMKRQYASAIITVLMMAGCFVCIFFMQLFGVYMAKTSVVIGGTNWASTIYSICNATMITAFNVGWRHFALFLCTWENYRLQPRYREMLTYKLFIFQCINCYFTLIFTAFFKPFGIRLFGLDMGRCDVRPLPGERSCADEVRELLYGVLFANILIGQATEVGTVAFQVLNKKIVSAIKNKLRDRKEAKARLSQVGPEDGGDVESKAPEALSLETISRKKRAKEPLTRKEEQLYGEQKKIIDLIGEFERPLVKSEKQGLGTTFYEYNELALQYGYLVLFSILLPAAPVLALVNNLVEVRSDAMKTIYASRRTRAEPAIDIGPWARALKSLSILGLAFNLGLLAITSDFFEQLARAIPAYESVSVRLGTCIFAEHVLLGLKLLIDFVVPDVPAAVKVRLHREEFVVEQSVQQAMRANEAEEAAEDTEPAPS